MHSCDNTIFGNEESEHLLVPEKSGPEEESEAGPEPEPMRVTPVTARHNSSGILNDHTAVSTSENTKTDLKSPQSLINNLYHSTWTLPSNLHTTLLRKLIKLTPGYSPEDCDAHIQWYLRYHQLTLVKRLCIQEWKGWKHVEQGKVMRGKEIDDVLDGGNTNPRRASTPNPSTSVRNTHVPTSSEDKEVVRARIQMWKEEKQRQLELEKVSKMDSSVREFVIVLINIIVGTEGSCGYIERTENI